MIFNLVSGGGKPKITYTGTHTTEDYTADGKAYTLYKLTGSGTLSVKGRAKGVDIWLCGGGANGTTGNTNNDATRCLGGAGAYCAQLNDTKLKGDYVVTIGAAQGATSFGSLLSVAAVSGKSGGTGGGGAGGYSYIDGNDLIRVAYANQGTGDGMSKIPFGDATAFQPHCAGGGAGGFYTPNNTAGGNHYTGGAGGTNGGSGAVSVYTSSSSIDGGAGGNKGGGRGGSATVNTSATSGGSASYYGSGGGGGGYDGSSYGADYGSGGAGYQGIVYVRVPA